ncbi:hypothetical protein U9M48_001996 [Paspalum notatum var. saurae]|uniref:Uncharacterized protein n=1 Tax=Paspalum notatum var. saurae TaxID=547442 RepID=A0AAQ3PJ34_PASNO
MPRLVWFQGIGSMKPSPAPLLEDAAVKADRKRKRKAEAYLADEREKRHQLIRDRKKRERDQRTREEGRSPTPSTASSDEEWSSDDTLEAVPLAGEIGESSGSGVLPEVMLIMTPPAAGAVPPLRGSQGSAGESQRVPVLATVVQARVEPVVEVPSSPEPEGSDVPVAVLTSTSVAMPGTVPVEASGGSGAPVLPSGALAELTAGSSLGALVTATVQGSPPGSESSLPVGASVAPVASHAPGPPLRVDAPSVSSPASANVMPGTASRGWRCLFPTPRSSRLAILPPFCRGHGFLRSCFTWLNAFGAVVLSRISRSRRPHGLRARGRHLRRRHPRWLLPHWERRSSDPLLHRRRVATADPVGKAALEQLEPAREGGADSGGAMIPLPSPPPGPPPSGAIRLFILPRLLSAVQEESPSLSAEQEAMDWGIVQEASTSAAVDVGTVLESLRTALAAASHAEEAISQRVLRHGAALLARATERISSLGGAQAEAAQARTDDSRLQEARAATVRQASMLAMRLDSVSAEASSLRAEVVSHFRELRPVLAPIAEGFAAGVADKKVERIEDKVSPHALMVSSHVDPPALLRNPLAD